MTKKLIKSTVSAGLVAAALASAAGASAQLYPVPHYYPERSLVTWDYVDTKNEGFSGLLQAEGITAVAKSTDTTVTVTTTVPALRQISHSIQIQTLCSDGTWVSRMAEESLDTKGYEQRTECPAGTLIEKSDVEIVVWPRE